MNIPDPQVPAPRESSEQTASHSERLVVKRLRAYGYSSSMITDELGHGHWGES